MHVLSIADAAAPTSERSTGRRVARGGKVERRFAGRWRCTIRVVDAGGTGRIARTELTLEEGAGALAGVSRGADVGADEGLDGPVHGSPFRDELVLCIADGRGRSVWVLEGRRVDGVVRGRASRACRVPHGPERAEGVFELERA